MECHTGGGGLWMPPLAGRPDGNWASVSWPAGPGRWGVARYRQSGQHIVLATRPPRCRLPTNATAVLTEDGQRFVGDHVISTLPIGLPRALAHAHSALRRDVPATGDADPAAPAVRPAARSLGNGPGRGCPLCTAFWNGER